MNDGVSSFVLEEVEFLIAAILLGVIIAFVYDTLRVLRRVIPHKNIVVSFEDLLFWIFTTCAIFILQYYENNGVFRVFSIIASLFGMILYHKIGSGLYRKYSSLLLLWLIGLFRKIETILWKPFQIINRKSKKNFQRFNKRIKVFLKICKNRLTKGKKLIKVTLCKTKRGES